MDGEDKGRRKTMYIENANKNFQETIVYEEYIPIEIKWKLPNKTPEGTVNIRYGNLDDSFLEVGVSESTGLIKYVTLVDAKQIFLNSNYRIKSSKCENGHPMFEKGLLKEKRTINLGLMLEVHVIEKSILLLLANDEINKYIVSGRVKFGINNNNELSCIIIDSLNDKEMKWIKNELTYML